MILSVSRRTDIPAFYADWFMNRINEGYVYVRNSFNANQVSNISLSPDIVDCIVFWTKNPGPMMKYLPVLSERYNKAFYFQYTINAYGKELEPAVPDLAERIDILKQISLQYGSDHMVWRYDPILLTDKYNIDWHITEFKKILNEVKGYTDTAVISFIDMYDKTKANTREYGIKVPNNSEMNDLAKAFSEAAAGSGITIKTCAEGIDLEKYRIQHNSCIDRQRIERIIGCQLKAKPDNQRADCQCIECADIGVYNTCMHGCKYCYANFNSDQVKKAVSEHNDKSPLLTGSITDSCVITNYSKAKTLKVNSTEDYAQMSLF